MGPALVTLDLTGLEIELVNVRNATRGVHDEIGLECLRGILGARMNEEARCCLLDSIDNVFGPHLDAGALKALHEPADEIRIEMRKHAIAALEYRHLSARMRGDV